MERRGGVDDGEAIQSAARSTRGVAAASGGVARGRAGSGRSRSRSRRRGRWGAWGESGDRVGVRVRGGGHVGQRGGPAGPGGPAGAEASWAARPSVGGCFYFFVFFCLTFSFFFYFPVSFSFTLYAVFFI